LRTRGSLISSSFTVSWRHTFFLEDLNILILLLIFIFSFLFRTWRSPVNRWL